MIGGLGTVIFSDVVVVVFVVVVCFVVVVVVCFAVVFFLGCSVIGAVVVITAVVALTGSCRADTGSLLLSCVVSRLVLSVADVGTVRVVVALVVVVATAEVAFLVVVVVVLLTAVVTLTDGFSLSVNVIADDEVVVTTSALGSADCAQPDSRAASMSIAIAFFIFNHPRSECQALTLRRRGNLACSFARR